MKTLSLLVWGIYFSLNLYAQSDSLILENIPNWVRPVLEKSEFADKYTILTNHNPFYFEEDFNGDRVPDIAFLVENKVDHTKGVMIVNNVKNLIFVVGASGQTAMGSNLNWMVRWFVYREKTVRNTVDKKTVQIKHPGIQLIRNENNSLIIYWTGRKYKTFARNF